MTTTFQMLFRQCSHASNDDDDCESPSSSCKEVYIWPSTQVPADLPRKVADYDVHGDSYVIGTTGTAADAARVYLNTCEVVITDDAVMHQLLHRTLKAVWGNHAAGGNGFPFKTKGGSIRLEPIECVRHNGQLFVVNAVMSLLGDDYDADDDGLMVYVILPLDKVRLMRTEYMGGETVQVHPAQS